MNRFSGRLPIFTVVDFGGGLSSPFNMEHYSVFSLWLIFCNMSFVLASVTLCFFLVLLSAVWWMRLRGLCKLLDGRQKLGLVLVGRALLGPLRPHGLQHARISCPSPRPAVYSNSCPLSQWCHPTISSSVIPFSSHLQSFPESGSFQMSQFFASGGQILEFQL